MSDYTLRKLSRVIQAALKEAEAAGPTTPESRAIIIGAAIRAVLSPNVSRGLIPYSLERDDDGSWGRAD